MHVRSRSSAGLLALAYIALSTCGLGATSLVNAQTQPESAAQTAARAAYARGVEAFSGAQYQLAHDQFALAQHAYPSPNIALMLGRSLVKLGRLREAQRMLQLAQAQADTPKYAAAAATAADELAAIEPMLVRVELAIDAQHGDELLLVNGEPLARTAWGEPLALDPGALTIELSRPGAPPSVRMLQLAAGATARVKLALSEPLPSTPEAPAARDSASPASPPATPAPMRPTVRGRDRSPWLRSVSYVLAGVGAAGLAAFGVFGAYSHARYSQLAALCPDGNVCRSEYRELATSGRTYQALANIALVAGGTALTGAGALWVLSFADGKADVDIGLSAVTVRGSF